MNTINRQKMWMTHPLGQWTKQNVFLNNFSRFMAFLCCPWGKKYLIFFLFYLLHHQKEIVWKLFVLVKESHFFVHLIFVKFVRGKLAFVLKIPACLHYTVRTYFLITGIYANPWIPVHTSVGMRYSNLKNNA